jgi:hypothetical protein
LPADPAVPSDGLIEFDSLVAHGSLRRLGWSKPLAVIGSRGKDQ